MCVCVCVCCAFEHDIIKLQDLAQLIFFVQLVWKPKGSHPVNNVAASALRSYIRTIIEVMIFTLVFLEISSAKYCTFQFILQSPV